MLSKLKANVNTVNKEKDFKKLATYVSLAKGYRSIGGFAADLKMNAKYIEDVIHARIISYPSVQFLKLVAENSEGRVSLKDLKLACGYSLYENNDLQQIKNIQVRRGWICYANFGEKTLDSEVGGYRPILIIQNDIGNKFSSNTIVLPITSRCKKNMPTHVLIGKESGLKCDSIISCELPNTISKRRISSNGVVQKIAECSLQTMLKVEICLLKAEGVIDININEDDAIEAIMNLNKNKVSKYQENNQSNNYKTTPQLAFA